MRRAIGPDRFTRFACFDWSGQAVARPRGIALAVAERDGPPRPIAPPGGWSREAALAWLHDVAAAGEPMLIGLDLSPALPFLDAGAYFPGWPESPPDARALWATVDGLSSAEPYLGAASVLAHPEIARCFRQHGGRLGDRFGDRPGGRLRVVEARCRDTGQGAAQSCFNLVGAAQVGKSSLTGMRVLHRLQGSIPVWPFDPVPAAGPVIVEIYTSIAARAAGIPPGRSKVRDRASLNAALAQLGSRPVAPLARYDDHITDAILTAAWLRRTAADPDLWSPAALTPGIAATEGWTFGVR